MQLVVDQVPWRVKRTGVGGGLRYDVKPISRTLWSRQEAKKSGHHAGAPSRSEGRTRAGGHLEARSGSSGCGCVQPEWLAIRIGTAPNGSSA